MAAAIIWIHLRTRWWRKRYPQMFIWQVTFYQGHFYSLAPSTPALLPGIHRIQLQSVAFCYGSKLTAAYQQQLMAVPSASCWKRCQMGWQLLQHLDGMGGVTRQVLNLLPFTSRHCWGKCQSKVCFALYSQICFVIKRLKVSRSWSLAKWHPKASMFFASTMFSSSIYKAGDTSF